MSNHQTVIGKEGGRRWVILGVIFICALAFAFTLQSVPPILSLVMAELKLSHAQGGLLMSFFALPGIIVSIPAGMLADRYSQKAIGVASLVLMIAGAAIFTSGSSMPILALGRVISGTGAMTLIVLAPQLLAQWFAGRQLGIAMGVFNAGVPFGTILSLNLLSFIGESQGWRTSIWLSAGLSLVALVVFAWLYAQAPRRSQQVSSPSEGFFRDIGRSGASIWLVGAAWMSFTAAAVSLFTFTPDLLKAAGFSITSAGFLTSLVMWPVFVLSPAVGYMIDKIDRKRTIIATGGLALAILMILIPAASNWIVALLLAIGLARSLVPAPVHTLASEVTSPERLGLGYGIIFTCQNLGILVGPAAVGLVKDVTGSYQASYALMSGFTLIISLMMIVLRLRHNRTPPNNTSFSYPSQ